MFFTENIYSILLAAAILHITDEFIYPGGFARKFREFAALHGLKTDNFQILIINILFISFCVFVFFYGKIYPLTGMSALMLVMLNGFAHLTITIIKKEYFPGIITGTMIYIPVGILALITMPLQINEKLFSVFIAAVFHSIPFLIMFAGKITFKRN